MGKWAATGKWTENQTGGKAANQPQTVLPEQWKSEHSLKGLLKKQLYSESLQIHIYYHILTIKLPQNKCIKNSLGYVSKILPQAPFLGNITLEFQQRPF